MPLGWDGEHSCFHSRHGGMPFCGCGSPFAGLLNVSWPSPLERVTNFIPRLQKKKKKPNPDLTRGALLIWEIGCKCSAEKRNLCERYSAFPQSLEEKKRKNGIWLNMFPFEKIHHSNRKCERGSVIVLCSNSSLAWRSLRWPLSDHVRGHDAGSCSPLQSVLAALSMWISSDRCHTEKTPSHRPTRKAVWPEWSKKQKYCAFKSYYY